jgi:hypothetical protein
MTLVLLPQHQRKLRRRNNVGSNTGGSRPNSHSRSRYHFFGLPLTCLTTGVVCLTILLLGVSNMLNFRQHQLDWIELDNISNTFSNYASKKTSLLPPCDDNCQIHRRQRLQQSGGVDLLSITDMISSVQRKKKALVERLGAPSQYGDLAAQLFNTRSGTQSLSSQLVGAINATANPSRDRLRDKVQRKVLQVQLELIQQDNRPAAAAAAAVQDYLSSEHLSQQKSEKLQQVYTDPSSMDKHGEATDPSSSTLYPPSVPYTFTQTRLVWATAGHGRSAGYGNLAEESYTAILQQAAGPVFGAAGIELTTRNYGWAAATDKSAPELALCLDSVYGTDVDILAWDFEESPEKLWRQSDREQREREQEHGWKRQMFWTRAALQTNRPTIVAMHLHDVRSSDGSNSERDSSHRTDTSTSHPILQELDQLGAHGLSALGWNPAVMARIHEHIIPDAANLLPGKEKSTPTNVRFFKCEGKVEAGPVCEDERFSQHADKACRNRWYRHASNPGWYVLMLYSLRWSTMMLLFLYGGFGE